VVLRKWQDAENVFPSAPVALYGCKTWSLTLRDDHRLPVFEMKLLRIIFRPKREERIEKWIRMHNEELNDRYWPRNIIRVIKSRRGTWAGHVARMRDRTAA
jgi:hypothetical protein